MPEPLYMPVVRVEDEFSWVVNDARPFFSASRLFSSCEHPISMTTASNHAALIKYFVFILFLKILFIFPFHSLYGVVGREVHFSSSNSNCLAFSSPSSSAEIWSPDQHFFLIINYWKSIYPLTDFGAFSAVFQQFRKCLTVRKIQK